MVLLFSLFKILVHYIRVAARFIMWQLSETYLQLLFFCDFPRDSQKSCWLTRGVSPSMWLITSFKTVLKSQLVMSFDKTLEMVTLNTCVQKYFSGKGSEKHCLFFVKSPELKKITSFLITRTNSNTIFS